MVDHTDDHSFSSFAALPFYGSINARLLDIAEIGNERRIVDLGCGTGAVTKLILERLQAACDSVVYAVDHSATALRAAVAELGDRRDIAVQFVQAEVQQFSNAVREQVDAVVYCNSIHYVPDKQALMTQIREKLRPGGRLAINTSFFEGSHPPESAEFYRRWMMRSLRLLKREHGLFPDKTKKVQARQQLTADEYESLLVRSGFTIVRRDIENVDVPEAGWYHISSFSDWIEGIMPGIPLDIGQETLQKGLRQVFDELNLKSVPRSWLLISAARV